MKEVWFCWLSFCDNDNLVSLPPVQPPLIHSGHVKTPMQHMVVGLLEHLEQTPAKKAKKNINFFHFHSSFWNFLVCLKVSGLEFREGGMGE